MIYIYAFIASGLICSIAQIIIDNSKLTPGHVTSIFVCLGVVLEAIGLYPLLRQIGYFGMSVPISNFGALMMEGIKECIRKDGILGVFSGIFSKTGIAITYTVFLSIIVAIFFKPKT